MRKDKLRRAAALIASAALAANAASCGKGVSSKDAPATADSLANSYSSSDIESDIPLASVSELIFDKNSGRILVCGRGAEKDYGELEEVYSANADLSGAKKVDLGIKEPANGENDVAVRFGADGNIYAFVISRDYGDYKLPDFDAPDFDPEKEKIDYEEIEKHAKTTAYIKSCKADGTEIATVNIDEEWVNKLGGRDFLSDFASLNGDSYVVDVYGKGEPCLTFINKEGGVAKEIELKEESVISFAPASSGELAALVYADEDCYLRYFNADGSDSSRENAPLSDIAYAGSVQAAPEGYDAAYYAGKGFFGVKDGKAYELLNFENSDIDFDSIGAIVPLDNGEFLLAENSGGKASFSRLAARNEEELKNVKLITVGVTWEDPAVALKINEYNRKNTGYRIKTVNYGNEEDEYEDYKLNAINALQKDIVSGKGPDIVVTDDRGLVTNLGKKGAFVDLYKKLENDPDLKKDDLLPNILKFGETDGKLVGLIPSFDVTTLVVKKKLADADGWTIDDMAKAYENRRANSEFLPHADKDSVLSTFLYAIDSFVDEENAKCSFDGDEFVKLLEFANNFPEKYKDIDYDNMTDEDFENYIREETLAYRNDKYAISQANIYDMKALKREELVTFGEPVSVVGYPSARGNGAAISPYCYISVMESSEYKDQCWDFVKSFFTPEAQRDSVGLPVLKSSFDEFVKAGMEKAFYYDESGKKTYYDDVCFVGDKEIEIPLLTQKECDEVKDYILGAEMVGQSYPTEIYKIIGEETKPYFAGEKTAEQAAEAIQNRATIYLSERS